MNKKNYSGKPKSQNSEYKRDIVRLIGVDMEAKPTDALRDVLNRAAAYLLAVAKRSKGYIEAEDDDGPTVEVKSRPSQAETVDETSTATKQRPSQAETVDETSKATKQRPSQAETVDETSTATKQRPSQVEPDIGSIVTMKPRNSQAEVEDIDDEGLSLDELLKSKLGMINRKQDLAEQKRRREDEAMTCKAFRANYWNRREGRVACNYRTPLGSWMSKKLMAPAITPEALAEMMKALKKELVFSLLSESKQAILVEAMSKLGVDPGEFLVKEGEYVDKFYYVHSGLFGTVVSSDKCYVVEYLKPGQCFGGEYLFFGGVSPKTIKCLQTASLWVMDSLTYHSFCHWGLEEVHALLEAAVQGYAGLEGDDTSRLVNALVPAILEQGRDVLSATPFCSLYVVLKGEVEVNESNPRGDVFTRTCSGSDRFGQDRLFSKRFCRLLSATTRSATVLYCLEEDAFHRLFDVPRLYKLADIEPYQDDLFYRTL